MERVVTQARGFAIFVLLGLFVTVFGFSPADAAMSDEQFVKQAGEGGLAEVALSRMAQQKASDPAVRAFADQMVNDHGSANRELMQLAQSEGIAAPRTFGPEHEQVSRELEALSGAEFDRRYMEAQIAEHQRAVNLFEEQAQAGASPTLQRFAEEKLPVLESHLERAQGVAQGLSG